MFHIDHKANKAEVNSISVSFNTLLLKGAINGLEEENSLNAAGVVKEMLDMTYTSLERAKISELESEIKNILDEKIASAISISIPLSPSQSLCKLLLMHKPIDTSTTTPDIKHLIMIYKSELCGYLVKDILPSAITLDQEFILKGFLFPKNIGQSIFPAWAKDCEKVSNVCLDIDLVFPENSRFYESTFAYLDKPFGQNQIFVPLELLGHPTSATLDLPEKLSKSIEILQTKASNKSFDYEGVKISVDLIPFFVLVASFYLITIIQMNINSLKLVDGMYIGAPSIFLDRSSFNISIVRFALLLSPLGMTLVNFSLFQDYFRIVFKLPNFDYYFYINPMELELRHGSKIANLDFLPLIDKLDISEIIFNIASLGWILLIFTSIKLTCNFWMLLRRIAVKNS